MIGQEFIYNYTTSSPSFSLMDSRAIESSRVSPFSRGVIFTGTHVFRSFPAWSFARPTIPDEKWENTRGPWVVKDCESLNRVQCKWKSFMSAINKNIKVIIKKKIWNIKDEQQG